MNIQLAKDISFNTAYLPDTLRKNINPNNILQKVTQNTDANQFLKSDVFIHNILPFLPYKDILNLNLTSVSAFQSVQIFINGCIISNKNWDEMSEDEIVTLLDRRVSYFNSHVWPAIPENTRIPRDFAEPAFRYNAPMKHFAHVSRLNTQGVDSHFVALYTAHLATIKLQAVNSLLWSLDVQALKNTYYLSLLIKYKSNNFFIHGSKINNETLVKCEKRALKNVKRVEVEFETLFKMPPYKVKAITDFDLTLSEAREIKTSYALTVAKEYNIPLKTIVQDAPLIKKLLKYAIEAHQKNPQYSVAQLYGLEDYQIQALIKYNLQREYVTQIKSSYALYIQNKANGTIGWGLLINKSKNLLRKLDKIVESRMDEPARIGGKTLEELPDGRMIMKPVFTNRDLYTYEECFGYNKQQLYQMQSHVEQNDITGEILTLSVHPELKKHGVSRKLKLSELYEQKDLEAIPKELLELKQQECKYVYNIPEEAFMGKSVKELKKLLVDAQIAIDLDNDPDNPYSIEEIFGYESHVLKALMKMDAPLDIAKQLQSKYALEIKRDYPEIPWEKLTNKSEWELTQLSARARNALIQYPDYSFTDFFGLTKEEIASLARKRKSSPTETEVDEPSKKQRK